MTLLQVIGVAMVVALFGGIFVLAARSHGLREAAVVFGITLVTLVWITAASILIVGPK